MPEFIITGNADEVSARLKSTLEANDARFKASLDALFKPAPPRPRPAPVAQVQSSGGSQESSGWLLSRKGDRTSRGR